MTKVYDLTKEGLNQFQKAVENDVFDNLIPALDNNDPVADEFMITVTVRGNQISIPMNAETQEIIFKALNETLICETEM